MPCLSVRQKLGEVANDSGEEEAEALESKGHQDHCLASADLRSLQKTLPGPKPRSPPLPVENDAPAGLSSEPGSRWRLKYPDMHVQAMAGSR